MKKFISQKNRIYPVGKRGSFDTFSGVIITLIIIIVLAFVIWLAISNKLKIFEALL